MPQRLKLILAYDGRAFAGWQSQSHQQTVQDTLERAIGRMSGQPARVHAAGRTDAGVHALGQCAHVDVAAPNLTPQQWILALNALLPPTLRVLRCRFVPATFHARFAAKAKVYRYRIWAGPILPPLEFGRAWHLRTELDSHAFTAIAKEFVGSHDFAAFSASRGKQETTTVRTIHSAHVRRIGPAIVVQFEGNGFLYKMVRLIVGAMARVGTGKLTPEEVKKQLASGRASGSRLAAPAEGLYLVRVRY
jgi:tRNA pseudouridine38-40 synthase